MKKNKEDHQPSTLEHQGGSWFSEQSESSKVFTHFLVFTLLSSDSQFLLFFYVQDKELADATTELGFKHSS